MIPSVLADGSHSIVALKGKSPIELLLDTLSPQPCTDYAWHDFNENSTSHSETLGVAGLPKCFIWRQELLAGGFQPLPDQTQFKPCTGSKCTLMLVLKLGDCVFCLTESSLGVHLRKVLFPKALCSRTFQLLFIIFSNCKCNGTLKESLVKKIIIFVSKSFMVNTSTLCVSPTFS